MQNEDTLDEKEELTAVEKQRGVICPVCKKDVVPSREAHFLRWANMEQHILHADCWQRVIACRMTLTEALRKGI